MEYINKHVAKLGGGKPTILAMSQDGGFTIVSAIFTLKGRKYYFYRDELEKA